MIQYQFKYSIPHQTQKQHKTIIYKKYNKKVTKRPENNSNGQKAEFGEYWQARGADAPKGEIHT